MLLDFFRNSIRSLIRCFLASFPRNFSTICTHMLLKFLGKSAQKSHVFPIEANFERSLFKFVFSLFCFFPFLAVSLEVKDVHIHKCAINRIDQRKGHLALCAIFRDEGNYLKEWIEYHRLVGVSHFYLYNNCSRDNFWEVLKPYVDQGIVELFDVPFDSYSYLDGAATHNFVQICCYNHAISLSKRYNEWIAIIDSDEFICPVIDKDIPSALSRFPEAGGLAVYWQLYGTSNVWDLQPKELMIEKLLLKMPNGPTGLFKSIVKPKHVKKCVDPHYTSLKDAPLLMPNHGSFSHSAKFDLLPIDILRINHYTYRTESYYYNHKKARRARWGYVPSAEIERTNLDSANVEYDPVMLRFVPELKRRMNY